VWKALAEEKFAWWVVASKCKSLGALGCGRQHNIKNVF
jgi:hypothetical protein